MKQTVNFSRFIDAFEHSQYCSNFSYEGKRALYNFLIDREIEENDEQELDLGEISAEWAEYESLEDFNNDRETDYEYIEDLIAQVPVINVPETSAFIVRQY